MEEWKKAYEMVVKNRLGEDTKFQIWLFTSAAVTLQKLALTKDPIIEFNTPEYGIGVMNYRTTITLLDNYNNLQIAEEIFTSAPGKLKFVINVKLPARGAFDAFVGFVDSRFYEQYIRGGDEVFDIDFVSGLSSNRDLPIKSTKRTDLVDIIEFVDGSGYANMNNVFYQITKKLSGYPERVLYAFSNIEFENWRYYTFPKPYNSIPDPNVIFNEMRIKLTNGGSPYTDDTTLEQMLNDICLTFFGTFGYSQFEEKLCFHHFLLGRDGNDYQLINKGPNGLTDMIGSFFEIPLVAEAEFNDRPVPRRINYPAVSGVEIIRDGPATLPEHPNEASEVNLEVDNEFILEPIVKTIKSSFNTTQYYVLTQDDVIGTPEVLPGRIIDRNYFSGTFGLLDISEQQLGWWATTFFRRRTGLRGKVMNWIDPMFPFIYTKDNTIHRLILGRQNPIDISTEFDTIEIGPGLPGT